MLFKKEHIGPIKRGRKTETRRFGKKRWSPGNLYWAQTSYAKASRFARIKCISVHQEKLGNITRTGAYAEGYLSVIEFLEAFRDINKIKTFDPNVTVWVVKFEVVEPVNCDG